jgi:hypothetical protein
VNHDQAWQRLPDLLDDRDDTALLAHVRDCSACQRQVFLLGRVDRVLRRAAPETSRPRRRRRKTKILAAGGAFAVAAAAAAGLAAALVVFLAGSPQAAAYTLHTPAGRVVGEATIGKSDARNASLVLAARDLPAGQDQVLVLWASDGAASIPVGRFMVDSEGDCRVSFNLPASHAWNKFWVTRQAGPIIARSPD